MWKALAEVIPLGIVNAIATVPLVVAIVLITGPRGPARALAYVLGWSAATVALGVVVLVLVDPYPLANRHSIPGMAASEAELGVGLLFIALAAWGWRRDRARRRAGRPPELPRWMRAIDHCSPGRALLMGIVMALRPKNLALCAAAAVGLAQAGVPFHAGVPAYLVFAAISTTSVAAPLVVSARLRERSGPMLARWKEWLVRYQARILVAIYLMIGIYLAAKGAMRLM